MATAISWISVLANRRSRSTSQDLSTLPRRGSTAWNSLSRPLLAEPPAASPSPRNTSVRAVSLDSPPVHHQGTHDTPRLLRFSPFCAHPAPAWGRCIVLLSISCPSPPVGT